MAKVRLIKTKDNIFKRIFTNNQLFCEFLRNFVSKERFSDIMPQQIKDVSDQFYPIIATNKQSDIVKKIMLSKDQSFYVIGLLEHQSTVDHRMSFRMLQYMVYIWSNYESEFFHEKQKKDFLYPDILPIVFYDGDRNWTAETNFKNKVNRTNILKNNIPDFEYKLINLSEISFDKLKENKDVISLLLMIDKISAKEDIGKLSEIPKSYYDKIDKITSDDVKVLLRDLAEFLLRHISVPEKEIAEFSSNIIEREVSSMFAGWDNFNIVKERAKIRREVTLEVMQQGIQLGKQEGRREGMQLGRRESVLSLYRKGFDVKFIADCLSEKEEMIEEWIKD